ncbi:MAG: hypothetical protein LBI18_03680 [Planctomycetaceae bacterium]|jgi:hypothetical protein|nr:hypothetical protein [Planctomycetaceae bacterium]
MRVDPKNLPASLRSIAENPGLEIFRDSSNVSGPYPIACTQFGVHKNPEALIASLPIMMNFWHAELNMDKEADREEYKLIMNYIAAGYGAKEIYIERKLLSKIIFVGHHQRKRIVQRIYIDYYAPYRVLDPQVQQAAKEMESLL